MGAPERHTWSERPGEWSDRTTSTRANRQGSTGGQGPTEEGGPSPFVRLLVATAVGLVLALLATAGPAAAAGNDDLHVEASVDGRAVDGAGSNDPVRLQPEDVARVQLTITNPAEEPVTVRRARLYGEAVGLTFVAYDAVLDVVVPAESSRDITFPVEFIDLERQATGLLPGGIVLYGPDREVLAREGFVIDVRGSATSALGLLGIFITAATAVGLVGIVVAVQRRRLGRNRVRRAVRFAFVGLGIGLTLVIGLAVFRIVAPTGTLWIPLTLIPTVAAAVLGFVSPGPLTIERDEWDDQIDAEVERIMADAGSPS